MTGVRGSSATTADRTLERIDLLFVCTANRCRSPMASALMRWHLDQRGVEDVTVHSAGLIEGGWRATSHAREIVPGLEDHVSRALTSELVDGADLVIGLAREHVREAAVLVPGAFAWSFTLKEIVRRGDAIGPRKVGEHGVDWLQRLSLGRTPADLLGSSDTDDVADPIGRSLDAYRTTATELDEFISRLCELVWPAWARSNPAAPAAG